MSRVSELVGNENPQQIAGDSPMVACMGIEPLSSIVFNKNEKNHSFEWFL